MDAAKPHRARQSSRKANVARLHKLAAERVIIENVWPEIDGGRHPVKRVVGDVLDVWADIFCDGHEVLAACLKYREAGENGWQESPLELLDNDRWHGQIPLTRIGRCYYTIEAWRDRFTTWRGDFLKKREAGQNIVLELREGRDLMLAAAEDNPIFAKAMRQLKDADEDPAALEVALMDEYTAELMHRRGPRSNAGSYRRELEVIVDREASRFSAWYELFPRSASNDPHRHGTFDDVIARLPYVRGLGFDVLYLPPIHPIGLTYRKGRNNALDAGPADPGSPWAIGWADGGHKAIHPQLGTLADFRRLVAAAREQGIEIALDFAIQCSRDHPWITEHPEWFDWRPDGSIKFAENPPKKYQDIVNVHFYGEALPALWYALRDVLLHWVKQGVRIFRVDNPHTKPVPFWEWLIGEVQSGYPDVLFLAEAFTRPKMMRKLAKVGFTQSYTYFTWRNTKSELIEYLTELTTDISKEYLRPNFFVNTPDINPPILQSGGQPAFRMRAALAATLSSVWGIYSGFELCEAEPLPDREEYLESEKYEIKVRNFDAPDNIRDYISRLNQIRRENPALQRLTNLRFHIAHDDNILFYGKMTANRDNVIWIAVNLDPNGVHECDIELPLYTLDLDDHASVQVEDLLADHRFEWRTKWQRLRLEPDVNPCAIWRITAA